ncbi:CPBP family intramembrane glutamic endopeptidase [Candidatus Nitrospira allomarina]|uniref:Type II CAAX endopeptidase family protein n=1 Tax=Candidatus Nitrospira allomarina TaxID=3020900 RepID=A0AA96JTT1_9BACT|nr:type II CAAX endopeptidase family protein [Candidatus Nitrospira allomarina]WNM59908.1 type II CAAX endopeptidase family protein [Candidatus Nitrospira allomarina]
MESDNTVELLPDTRPALQEEIQFSGWLTGLCLLFCAGGLGLLFWAVTLSDDVRLASPASRDLERIASRMLGFESRLPELSSFEQVMYHLGGQDGETLGQIQLWYEERVDDQSSPLDKLYLGMLYGEAGLTDQFKQFVMSWSMEHNSPALFRRLLEVGYGQSQTSPAEYVFLQAQLAEEVPANWFYFHLARRIAVQAGDQDLQENLQLQEYQLTDPPLWRWRVLLMGEVVVIGFGVVFFLRLGFVRLKGRSSQSQTDFAAWRIPWTFREGIAVLARGGALTILLMGLVAVMPDGIEIIEDFGIALLYLPPVVLTAMLLCRTRKQSLLQVVGCSNVWQRLKSGLPLIVMLVTLGLVGDWLIMLGGDAFQSSVHWTEWFVPQLIWGTRMELIKTTIDFVLLAPFFEELIFRGILYTTLRTKFSFPLSMVASGLIFALAHGYGLIAFLTVFWSGLLWAWAYERTGSVIPGMVAHAVNNGVVVYSLVSFFR